MQRLLDIPLVLVLLAVCGCATYFAPSPALRGVFLVTGLYAVGMRALGRGTSACQPVPPAVRRKRPTKSEAKPSSPAVRALRPKTTRAPADLNPDELVHQMVDQGRAAVLLHPEIAAGLSSSEWEQATAALDEATALVPAGPVIITPRGFEPDGAAARYEKVVEVEAYLLDRYPVTNRDYQVFVDDGGYEQMNLWEPAIWPAVLQFVDRTGHPGPHYWEHGEHPAAQADHPVVGISWFEAAAYARWAGKRLATDAEWTKAAAWPVGEAGERPTQRKYPWGDVMDRRLANLWGATETTTPVTTFPGGGAVNGVYDLIGNVWEWTASPFDEFAPSRLRWETDTPLRSIRGGAFDTYFDTQAATTFASGADPFARLHNVGFRCAVSLAELGSLTRDSATTADPPTTGETP